LSIAFGRYESYLINLFLQEESFHDERRREKENAYTIYHRVVVKSFSSFSSKSFKSKSKSKRESTFGFVAFRRRLKKKKAKKKK
tara:strand:- start:367 stop:618 length:252 start_codon:yes stop_codon:yes gene_type:complete